MCIGSSHSVAFSLSLPRAGKQRPLNTLEDRKKALADAIGNVDVLIEKAWKSAHQRSVFICRKEYSDSFKSSLLQSAASARLLRGEVERFSNLCETMLANSESEINSKTIALTDATIKLERCFRDAWAQLREVQEIYNLCIPSELRRRCDLETIAVFLHQELVLKVGQCIKVASFQGDFTPPDRLKADYTDLRASLLYYIGGWLLRKVVKDSQCAGDIERRAFFTLWAPDNTLNLQQAESQGLPVGMIVARQKVTQRLLCPSAPLLDFLFHVEATYVKLLTSRNLLARSSSLIEDVHNVLIGNKFAKQLFTRTLSETSRLVLKEHERDISEVMEPLLAFLLTSYWKMRGRDFAKGFRSKICNAARVARNASALRSLLASLSAPERKGLLAKQIEKAQIVTTASMVTPPAKASKLSDEEVLAKDRAALYGDVLEFEEGVRAELGERGLDIDPEVLRSAFGE